MVAMIPNCITGLRMVGTACLLFLKPYAAAFYVVYVFCGLTDILDGWFARLTRTGSPQGARLDSIADLLFYTVMAIKIFPALLDALPVSVWIIVWTTVALRVLIYGLVAFRYRRFAASHTLLNKLTGFIVFLLPFSLLIPAVTVPFGYFGAFVAAAAAIYELYVQFGQPAATKATS